MDRETVGGQHERLLREAHDMGPTLLDAFGPYLEFRPDAQGDATIAGLAVTWENVALDSSVAPRPMDAEELRTLREHNETWKAWLAATHKPFLVEGRIARTKDDARELVAGTIRIEGFGTWEGRRRNFLLRISYEMGPPSPLVSLTMPEERLPARRLRPWKMVKDALGDDLLAPYAP